jgi:hypothetical protein
MYTLCIHRTCTNYLQQITSRYIASYPLYSSDLTMRLTLTFKRMKQLGTVYLIIKLSTPLIRFSSSVGTDRQTADTWPIKI